MTQSLTREEFCLGMRCPLLLWEERTGDGGADRYTEHDLAAVNNKTAADLFAAGHDGVVFDLAGEAVLASSSRSFCRPVFDTGRFSCCPDLLVRRNSGGYELYTVRAAAHIRQMCIKDAAYQLNVLAECGLRVVRSFSVRINTDFDASDETGGQFICEDITAATKSESARCKRRAEGLWRVITAPFPPEKRLHPGCMNPTDCRLKAKCFSDLPKPNVFDVSGLSSQIKFKLCREGTTSFDELRREQSLSRLQRRRVSMTLDSAPPTVDASNIRAFLKTLWYPVCFLDFESYQTPFPRFKDMKPFEQIAFQFSLHTVSEKGGEAHHDSFIVPPDTDPRVPMAESLARLIPTDACVVAYNMQFEKMILLSLAGYVPQCGEKLSKIAENLRDMMTPFRKGFYYHPAQYGSFSLKSVMRAVFGGDEELDYSRLDGVHNGGQAAAAYALCAAGAEGVDTGEVIASLEKYCNLDTLSLVRILRLFESLAPDQH